MTRVRDLLLTAHHGVVPAFAGAVVMAAESGVVTTQECVGETIAWADDARTPWSGESDPVTVDTLFDVASLTKLFTAAAVLIALDHSNERPDAPAHRFVPELGAAAARDITVAHLLTHTAGFAAEWRDAAPDAASADRFRATRPQFSPGSTHLYSCVGYIWAGFIAESITGERLDESMQRAIFEPLGMTRTGFTPSARAVGEPIAATEFQRSPARGLVHGHVHDEASWALGGIAGNAGLFSSARELLTFAELLRNGGLHDGYTILAPWVHSMLSTDQLPATIANHPGYGQAMGARVGDRSWMGTFANSGAIGHTGFTGTSLLTQPDGDRSVVFLSNRVHPSRDGTDLRVLRATIADAIAHTEEPE
ncbi:hypothetical protein GCM10009860_25770 [Microbacterium mitrae]|nr:serine hydrolase domain-containing protein [Microbacterium mitrae]